MTDGTDVRIPVAIWVDDSFPKEIREFYFAIEPQAFEVACFDDTDSAVKYALKHRDIELLPSFRTAIADLVKSSLTPDPSSVGDSIS